MNTARELPSPSSSSLSMATNTLEENEDGFADNQIELRLSRDDGDENDDIYQTAVPPLLSSTRRNNCIHTSPRLQQRRRQMEQANRGQHLEVQPRQEPQRQGQTAAGEAEAEAEAEQDVIQPATSTTISQKSLFVLRPVHRYVDLVCIGLSVLAYLLETTMNAALAIFGIGVGVGLVLGDSFRATLPLLPSVQASQQQQQHQQAQQSTVAPNRPVEEMASHELIDPRNVSNLLPAQ